MSNNSKYLKYAVLIVSGAVLTYFNRNIHVDDALIYYRYIENFISGNGLVYNIGERFNGLTSPLYVYLSILISSVTGEVEVTQVVLNALFMILSSILIYRVFIEQNLQTAGFISALIYITSKYFYTVFGLETNLFVLISLICIYLYVKQNIFLLSVFSGLLLTVRGEGLFLIIILFVLLYKKNRDLLNYKYLFPLILFPVISIIFSYYYYGELLPHTLSVKVGQGSSGLWGKYSYLFGSTYLFGMFNNQAFYILFIFSAAVIGLIKNYKNTIIVILLLYAAMLTIFYLALNIPSYHWYYSIHFLTLFVLCGFGVSEIITFVNTRFTKRYVSIAIICIILIYPVLTQLEIARLMQNEKPHTQYMLIGRWLRDNTDNSTVIAAVEIGHIGWYSKKNIVDILGLTNPYNAEFVSTGQFSKWYDIYKPDYIISHEPHWPQEEIIPVLLNRGEYVKITIPGVKDYNILKSAKLN